MADRIPAQNLDAEASVLSTVLLDGAAGLALVRDIVAEADWYSDANRSIWRAAVALEGEGKPIDLVTVAERLRATGDYGRTGGVSYLAQLTEGTPAVANLEAHARIIADKARQRSVVELCRRMAVEGYEDREDVDTWVQDAATALTNVAIGGRDRDPAESFDELVPRVTDTIIARSRGEAPTRTQSTGWAAYDRVLGGGWEIGQGHIVAGRPGMGKTAKLMGAALNVAKQGLGVVFVSAEMPKEQLVQRALACEASVDLRKLKAGRMTRAEWDAVAAASQSLRRLPISLKYKPAARVGDVGACLLREERKLRTKFGVERIGLGIVDYIQLLDDERQPGVSRENALADVSRKLTWLAGRHDIPLLIAAQINRAVESRANANARPRLSDLRESGAIEQDAFTVTFLYRDEYYNKDSEWAGTAEFIVAKNRDGATGTCRLGFVDYCARFTSLKDDDRQEELY